MAEKKENIHVPIGEAVVARGETILETYGLGSCIALILYDPSTSIGGLAHVMLPEKRAKSSNLHPYKYCNTAVPNLLSALIRKGAKKESIWAKLIGGSKMFSTLIPKEIMDVGFNNIKAARAELFNHNIPLIAEDTGGTYGRSIKFYLAEGKVKVSSYYKGIIHL